MTNTVAYYEHLFIDIFNKDNPDKCTVHFHYSLLDAVMNLPHNLAVTTYNPVKDATFLLLKVAAMSSFEAIQKAVTELQTMHRLEYYASYTVVWSKVGDQLQHTSYFYGKSPMEVLEKFYALHSKEDIIFYSLKLNPLS